MDRSPPRMAGDNRGFTMIELIMVIVIVGVLGSVALPQFLDFRSEGHSAVAKQTIGTMRSVVVNMKAQMLLRCGATGAGWPTLNTINTNDIVVSGDCTSGQIPNTADRKIIDISLTTLPVLMGEVGTQPSALPYLCAVSLRATNGNLAAYSPGGVHGTSLWCYDNAGNFWAESSTYPTLHTF